MKENDQPFFFVYFSSFRVDFAYAQPSDSNNAFHFNPRINNGTVVRNTFFGGKWLTEEREKPYMPFIATIRAEIYILVQMDKYRVSYVHV